ncbi:39S ribosomal protein L51, mitochondrial-like [Portunus trituberculatus]|uniref:39S ribosomal protein L51, mitochondrial-like n=1 Tax=Portunus trituberculatus TaxID=210409 RepID=UPI001E1CD746|nr:39S ribosomal protein L51, mitochondrial-like [Portunus trituberculatus]XP_045105304.1 39S ribosomal protein L51, mitochondrial-like [Portunus trituberculatus]XP_045105308.1 39S ribosomal protein L51, mitochondrial-like [Portunus trituberculatus]
MAAAVKSLLGALSRVATPSYGAAVTAAAAARMSQGWAPLVTSVRHRYHWQKMEKGPLLRNYGEKEPLHNKGLLPHMEHHKRLPIPLFRPKNNWAEKRALFGQNDYIDILGPGNLHPTKTAYSVPAWLRGFKGNEYQMLLRKKKMFGRQMGIYRPTKRREMEKRIVWLYKFLNFKTKDYMWKKA